MDQYTDYYNTAINLYYMFACETTPAKLHVMYLFVPALTEKSSPA